MRLTPGVDLIKLFWSTLTHAFCKLDHFIRICNTCDIAK